MRTKTRTDYDLVVHALTGFSEDPEELKRHDALHRRDRSGNLWHFGDEDESYGDGYDDWYHEDCDQEW